LNQEIHSTRFNAGLALPYAALWMFMRWVVGNSKKMLMGSVREVDILYEVQVFFWIADEPVTGGVAEMEISPVNAVRLQPMIRQAETDLGLMDVGESARSSRMGDETYEPSGVKAASGFEEDESEKEEMEEEVDENGRVVVRRRVSYLA
jgi:hypothetical protein